MEIKTIKTKEDYHETLSRVEELVTFDPAPGSPDAELLDVLSILLTVYEDAIFPIEKPDPIDAIQYRMEDLGLKQRDLVPYIGSKSRVSEILSGKRNLTLRMIRSLHQALGIPLSVLLQESSKAS